MKRLINYDLLVWKDSPIRKPLIMRGARQVGKTYAVRMLAKKFTHFLEINFERQPKFCNVFQQDLDPKRIINTLAIMTQQAIVPGETLLFLDEIQNCPQAIIALRYFYEEMPKLHVIAAGSLLDFAIEKVGVPVGRVAFCYLYPVSFMEYLAATNHAMLLKKLLDQNITQVPLDKAMHTHIMQLLGEYMLLGGLPEVVHAWVKNQDLLNCAHIQYAIINAYRDDFPKYAKKLQIKYLDSLFNQIPHMITEPFKFNRITGGYQKRELEPALDLLLKAGVVYKVQQTSGQGLPLGADVHLEKFKLLFLDCALTQTMLGLDMQDWLLDPLNMFSNKGALTEAFVGQELLAYLASFRQGHLYYWHRLKRGSEAEVDYVLPLGNVIVPVEVKSGKGSTLKSLHLFLDSHPQSPYGIRFSIHNYSVVEKLHSVPLYAIATVLAQQDATLLKKLYALLN